MVLDFSTRSKLSRLRVGLRASRSGANGSISLFETALDAGEKIKVMVDAGWGGQLRLLDEFGGVAYARALRPLLVTLVARQRACPRRTARTAVLGFAGVAGSRQLALSMTDSAFATWMCWANGSRRAAAAQRTG